MFGKKVEINTDEKLIDNILSKNVEDIFVRENLKKQLMSGKQLRVKLGFDPTGAKIHIGRAAVLRKLKEFQDLGHQIIFLVGDFTARIGDPSDKLEKRPMLDDSKIKENLKDYKNQIGKIIDINKAEFVYNSKWLSKLTFEEIVNLAESFTVSQMISRRNFKDRLDKGDEVSLREFLYPLMQGYDSVVLKADVEIGGFDQLFNLKAGRTVQKYYKQKEQDILTTVMLEGTDGRKMSTSWGNVINIVDEPNDMFGKVMSVHDDLIGKYFEVCTNLSVEEISKIQNELSGENANPRDTKMNLAYEIVKIYHGESNAEKAKQSFINTFQKKEGMPSDAEVIEVSTGDSIGETLVLNKIVSSKSEWRRLVDGGAVMNLINKKKVIDSNAVFEEKMDLRIGKKRFVKVKVS